MISKIKIHLITLFVSILSFSQEIEPIQTDRPDQTETPSLVPSKMFQIETGFSFQKNYDASNSITIPSILWKYGLNENFEMRLISEYSIEENNTSKFSGLNPILIGCKIKISDEKGLLPKTSFIGHISLPNLASTAFKGYFFAPEFRFVMQHSLSDSFSLGYNFGAEWDSFTPEPTFIYTLTTGYSVSEKMGTYIEIFGFAPQKNIAYHSFDGGVTYLVTNNFMLDLSGGFGLTEFAPEYYYALGVSFRI